MLPSSWNQLAAAALTSVALACASEQPPAAPAPPPTQSAPALRASAAAPPQAESAASASAAAAAPRAPLTLVTDNSLVCMVNNQYMGRPQIPIEAEGRTYYGCCEMCKGRLARDPTSRVATDPVSQRVVDKATAVIGKTAEGRTFYFESQQTFAAYSGR